jgi:NADH:ubiquinone oxidoreductase subunit 6 (subunit J)
VGAISILFLFVVMMLNIRVVEIYLITYRYLPIGLVIGFLLLCEILLFILLGDSNYYLVHPENNYINWSNFVNLPTNIEVVAIVLFNYYWVCLIIVGLILFVAMLGAIIIA